MFHWLTISGLANDNRGYKTDGFSEFHFAKDYHGPDGPSLGKMRGHLRRQGATTRNHVKMCISSQNLILRVIVAFQTNMTTYEREMKNNSHKQVRCHVILGIQLH